MLLTGLVASGLSDLFPPFVRFLIVFPLFSFLPGWVIVAALPGGHCLAAETRLAASCVTGLAFYAVVAWALEMAGASLDVFVDFSLVASFGIFGYFFVRGYTRYPSRASGSRSRARSAIVWSLCGVLGVFYALAPPEIDYRGDAYDHVGYVRRVLLERRMTPDGVLAPPARKPAEGEVAIDGSQKRDPRKGAMHSLLAVMSETGRIDPAELWRDMPVFLAPVAVAAFWGFTGVLLPGPLYVALCMLLFLMFQGGLAADFLATVAYGQNLALVFYWVIVVLVREYALRARGAVLALMLTLLVGGGLIHIDVVIHYGLMAIGIVLMYRAFEFQPRILARFAALSALGAGAVIIWKLGTSYGAANLLHLHAQGLLYFGDLGAKWFVPSPVEVLKKQGLLFLVGVLIFPALWALRTHRESARRQLALGLPALLIVLNPWVVPFVYAKAGYLVHRFLLNVPAFAATVLVLGSIIPSARRGGMGKKVIVVLALFFYARVFLVSCNSWMSSVRDVRLGRSRVVPDRMSDLVDYIRKHVAQGSVVLTDPVTAYTLTAFTDVRVVAVLHQHGDPNDAIAFERLKAVRVALSQFTTQREATGVVDRFHVDYVLLNAARGGVLHEYLADWDPEAVTAVRTKFETMPERFRLVRDDYGMVLYRVRPGETDVDRWFPTVPFGNGPAGNMARCGPAGRGAALVITGVSVEPAEALPGETVRVTVAYRKHRESDSALPLEFSLRLEDREYFAAGRQFPGDKYLRRFRERRQGAFLRYRIDRVPFGGLYTAEMWPLEREVYDVFSLQLPVYLRETTYELDVRLARKPLVPNFSVRDFIYNEDSFSGQRCGVLRIRKTLTR